MLYMIINERVILQVLFNILKWEQTNLRYLVVLWIGTLSNIILKVLLKVGVTFC